MKFLILLLFPVFCFSQISLGSYFTRSLEFEGVLVVNNDVDAIITIEMFNSKEDSSFKLEIDEYEFKKVRKYFDSLNVIKKKWDGISKKNNVSDIKRVIELDQVFKARQLINGESCLKLFTFNAIYSLTSGSSIIGLVGDKNSNDTCQGISRPSFILDNKTLNNILSMLDSDRLDKLLKKHKLQNDLYKQ